MAGQPSAWVRSTTVYHSKCPQCGHDHYFGSRMPLDGEIVTCECGKQFFAMIARQGDVRKATGELQ